jgi:mannose-1-phosphate guanylyltransferase
MGSVRTEINKERVFEVDKFLEKPDQKMAEKLRVNPPSEDENS